MKQITIAISGIAGSFDDEAAQKYLTHNNLEGDLIYAITAKQTFADVMSGQAEYGIVPLENSVGGMVMETLYAMAEQVFKIVTIVQIDVQQNLLALPGTNINSITHVVSHPQALAQCRTYLKQQWESASLEEYPDTALAAKDLKSGKFTKTTAVIASRQAAKLFELNILEPGIQDLKFNITAFMVFTRK